MASPVASARTRARIVVHTLCFKNKLVVPSRLVNSPDATVEAVRIWVAERLHFPADEAMLVAKGRRLQDSLRLVDLAACADIGVHGKLHVHLVCVPPPSSSDAPALTTTTNNTTSSNFHSSASSATTTSTPATPTRTMTIYVEDTTRLPHKTYAVKMGPSQTASDLKAKIFSKSSCTVPPRLQKLVARGIEVDDSYSLREFAISQRPGRVVWRLSTDLTRLADEDLPLLVQLPNSGADPLRITLRADQTIGNLRQALDVAHGFKSERYSLVNRAGLVLPPHARVRDACTIHRYLPVTLGDAVAGLLPREEAPGHGGASDEPVLNTALFMVPMPETQLTNGLWLNGVIPVYLSPQHLLALGIRDLPISSASSKTAALKRAQQQRQQKQQQRKRRSPLPDARMHESYTPPTVVAANAAAPTTPAASAAATTTTAAAAKASSGLNGLRGLFTRKPSKALKAAAVSGACSSTDPIALRPVDTNSQTGNATLVACAAAAATAAAATAAATSGSGSVVQDSVGTAAAVATNTTTAASEEPSEGTKVKKQKTHKQRLREMMRHSQLTKDDKAARFQAKLARSLGGGEFKRVDCI
jgi:hypothetical protein